MTVSMEDEINHHLTNINRLTRILVGAISAKIVLAVTHCDELSVTWDEIDWRFPEIESDDCARLGIRPVKWSNAPRHSLPDQYTNLKDAIHGMQRVSCSITTEIESLILSQAKALADARPPPTE